MNITDCINRKWFNERRINGFTDNMCTWRRFNATAKGKILTPGRLVRIDKIKKCPKN